MAKLTARRRNQLPNRVFALPGRHYPLDTKNRARNALTRISAHGSPQEKATVRRKVHARYPGIQVSGLKKTSIRSRKHARRKRVG
jgi:hypothetical protein